MKYLPIFLKAQQQRCLIVGGGRVAKRKAQYFVRAGVSVSLVSPEVDPDLHQLLSADKHVLLSGEYAGQVSTEYDYVVAATNNTEVNQQVMRDARASGVPVNVVDSPADCDFILPALVDRGQLQVAVSSSGGSPVLTRQVKSLIEQVIPSGFARLAAFADKQRQRVKTRFSTLVQRQHFWQDFFNSSSAEAILAGREKAGEQMFEQQLERANNANAVGEVFLVGAGPGDPDLLTVKAHRIIQQADVVLYDRLVSEPIMALVRKDADKVYVGKRRDDHAVPQEQISQLLVDYAKQGCRVLRLKGGDPFIFGRGGEEIELLAENQVPFQVVPGITAASGCSAYTGIPLTHRDYSQSVRFITGHLKEGQVNLNWPELASSNQTLVFYMGLMGLEQICRSLVENGRSQQTPVAIIERGTTPKQRVIQGQLDSIVAQAQAQKAKAPSLLIIGEVVNLRETLKWFDS